MTELAVTRPQNGEVLPQDGYSAALLYRCAADGSIPAETLEAIRQTLHRAAGEHAAAYTRGRSCAVTRKQAEAFYRSVFYQLDAALLALGSDSLAADALRTQAPERLLDAGQTRIMRLYEQAKTDFRRAWKLTEPFATSFFRALLPQFSAFCTQYDVRFGHDRFGPPEDYPLLGENRTALKGVLGLSAYYHGLMCEGEMLSLLPAERIRAVMQQYAARFRTAPENIAENIAELMLKQQLASVLAGHEADSLTVTAEDAAALTAEYAVQPESVLRSKAETAVRTLYGQHIELCSYICGALPAVVSEMHRRMKDGSLRGWIPACSEQAEQAESTL